MVRAMSNELVDWAYKAFEIFSGEWIDFILSFPDSYTIKDKKKAIVSLPSSPWRWRILLVYRSKGFFDYSRLLRQKQKIWLVSKRQYIVMSCIAILPKPIASFILKTGLWLKANLRKYKNSQKIFMK